MLDMLSVGMSVDQAGKQGRACSVNKRKIRRYFAANRGDAPIPHDDIHARTQGLAIEEARIGHGKGLCVHTEGQKRQD